MFTLRPARYLGMILACLPILVLIARPLAGQRESHQGDMWMAWSDESRQAYYLAYGEGYTKARVDLCEELLKHTNATAAINPCGPGAIDLSKGSDYFVEKITD